MKKLHNRSARCPRCSRSAALARRRERRERQRQPGAMPEGAGTNTPASTGYPRGRRHVGVPQRRTEAGTAAGTSPGGHGQPGNGHRTNQVERRRQGLRHRPGCRGHVRPASPPPPVTAARDDGLRWRRPVTARPRRPASAAHGRPRRLTSTPARPRLPRDRPKTAAIQKPPVVKAKPKQQGHAENAHGEEAGPSGTSLVRAAHALMNDGEGAPQGFRSPSSRRAQSSSPHHRDSSCWGLAFIPPRETRALDPDDLDPRAIRRHRDRSVRPDLARRAPVCCSGERSAGPGPRGRRSLVAAHDVTHRPGLPRTRAIPTTSTAPRRRPDAS
jgi:hypothetical protein